MRAYLLFVIFGTAAAQTLTPAQALRVRQLSNLSFSPDGKMLAFEVREPPKGAAASSHIWVLSVPGAEPRQWTNSQKSETSPQWSPDRRSLALLSNRVEGQQVYLMPANGGEPRRLTEGKSSVGSFRWSPDGKRIAFLAAEEAKPDVRVASRDEKHPQLWVIDVESRKARQLTKAPWRVPELCWTPAGDWLLLKATDHPEPDQWTDGIYKIVPSGGTASEVATPLGPFRDLQVSLDGKQLAYVAAQQDGPIPHDLYLLSLSDRRFHDLTDSLLSRPILQYAWRPDGSVLALDQDGFEYQFQIVRAESVERVFPKFPLYPTAFALSAQGTLAMAAGSFTAMPELWISTSGGAPRQVSHFNEEWKTIPPRPAEIVQYDSFDGKTIEAAVVKPAGAAGRKLPLVVVPHGGPAGALTQRFQSWAQLLAARGYLVLCPNIRGSTGYGHEFVEMNQADWGGADFKDLMAGVDWLIKRGDADRGRLGIGGWSYGGYMAAWAITQTTRFKAAVAGAPMSDLASEFGTEDDSAEDEWSYGLPYENLANFQKSSPITFVKNARTPTLILQGEADKVDPIGQSQQLYRGLKRSGAKAELVVYPREGHTLQEESHAVDVLERMVAWFDTYLK